MLSLVAHLTFDESGGSIAHDLTGALDGMVDDVQVYSSALTDAQITYLFAHPGRVASRVQCRR